MGAQHRAEHYTQPSTVALRSTHRSKAGLPLPCSPPGKWQAALGIIGGNASYPTNPTNQQPFSVFWWQPPKPFELNELLSFWFLGLKATSQPTAGDHLTCSSIETQRASEWRTNTKDPLLVAPKHARVPKHSFHTIVLKPKIEHTKKCHRSLFCWFVDTQGAEGSKEEFNTPCACPTAALRTACSLWSLHQHCNANRPQWRFVH